MMLDCWFGTRNSIKTVVCVCVYVWCCDALMWILNCLIKLPVSNHSAIFLVLVVASLIYYNLVCLLVCKLS